MRTYVRAILLSAAAVFLAYMFVWVARENLGLNPESEMLDRYNDYMLEAKSYFVDNSDDFQALAAGIAGMDGLTLLRGKPGLLTAEVDGVRTEPEAALASFGAADPQALIALAERLMSGRNVAVTNGDGEALVSGFVQVYTVAVTEGALLYYTHYGADGVVGVAYLGEPGYDGGFELILLTEEWYIFYDIKS